MADQTAQGPAQADTDGRAAAHGRLFVLGVIGAGLAVLGLSTWHLLTHPASPSLIVLLALTAGAGWLTLRVPSMPISFSISDTFSTAAALLVGPAAGALTAALDGVMLSFRMQSSARTPSRLLFNLTAPPLAIWLAAQTFFALAGPRVLAEGPWRVPRLFALVAVFGVLNFGLTTGLVATAVGLERRTPIRTIWGEHFVGLWVTYLGGVFASMLMVVLSGDRAGAPMSPLEVLLLIAPLPVILYVTFTNALGRAQDQIEHLGGMNRVYVATIEALAQTIDAKDQVTHDHIRRVQENSVRLARAIGVTDDQQIQALKAASLLHDVGKISVPEHILNKPGRLNPSELEIMKRHAPVGGEILSVIGFPYPVVPIVRHHHENWDGSGYPDGLSGESIPIGARILSVVDCFDALTSDRPYRPRFDPQAALQVLLDRRGTMYDPHVVDAFMALHAEGKNEMPPPSRAPVADPHAQPAQVEEPSTGQDSGLGELEAFSRLGADLAATRSIEEVGRAVWRHLQMNLQAATIVLFTYDESSDALMPAFHAGAPAIAPSTLVPVGERLSGWVAATRQPIVNSDARLDVDPDLRDDSRLQSALSVPILTGERFIGVLAFYSDRSQAFTPSHQRLAEAAASIVAVLVAESGLSPALVPAGVSRPGTAVSRI